VFCGVFLIYAVILLLLTRNMSFKIYQESWLALLYRTYFVITANVNTPIVVRVACRLWYESLAGIMSAGKQASVGYRKQRIGDTPLVSIVVKSRLLYTLHSAVYNVIRRSVV
jgi:hypothetical protein